MCSQSVINPKPNQKWLVLATSIEQGQPAYLRSLTRIYTIGCPSSNSNFISLKMIMDSSKNARWIIPFQKFGRLRVNFFDRGDKYDWTCLGALISQSSSSQVYSWFHYEKIEKYITTYSCKISNKHDQTSMFYKMFL